MEQVQDNSGQVARVEVERLNNLPMELEEIDQPPRKRTIGEKTVKKVLVPGRGRSKKKRLEGSMVVRSLDSFVVRVLSPAKRDREELVGTEDAVSKWAKLE